MKSLTKYLRKRHRNIQQLLRIPHQEFNMSVFHQLRVEIKKINALLKLINTSTPGFHYRKTFAPFKKIFDQSGKIREIQLEQSLISKNHLSVLLHDHLSDLKNLLLAEKNVFFAITDEIILEKLKKKHRQTKHKLSSTHKSKMAAYVRQYRKKIGTILSSAAIEKDQAHQLRKKIKNFDSFRRMLDMEDCIRPFPKHEKLIEMLGVWHDGQVTIRHLDKCIDSVSIPHAEIKPMQKLKEKIYSKNEKLLVQINSIIS